MLQRNGAPAFACVRHGNAQILDAAWSAARSVCLCRVRLALFRTALCAARRVRVAAYAYTCDSFA